MRILPAAVFALGIWIAGALSPLAAEPPVRERISFNDQWRFTKGDPQGEPALSTSALNAWQLQTATEFLNVGAPRPPRPTEDPGAGCAFVRPEFDDAAWRALSLPHDWAIEGPFDPNAPAETGKLPWSGVGWYRKHFAMPAADANRRICLDLDGAMSHTTVWLNGHCVGGWPYGYASWQVDLTPYVNFGGENVLAIRLDNPPESSRWYPGGGIYRPVWLVKTSPVHVAHWGTFVTTPIVTAEAATIAVEVTVQNDTTADAEVEVSTALYELDAQGSRGDTPVSSSPASGRATVAAHRQASVARTASVPHPKRWTPKQANRYVAVTTVKSGGRTVDEYETPFGIRTIAFTPDRGFLLNGERVPLQGVCLHHDLGALGAAVNVRALERQLEILREMGCNAIRTSHNPPAPELLDLADRMGFLVMDEAFDCWIKGKRPNDYHLLFPQWHEPDLRAFVRRDRNHPSVILWSIGNEVGEQSLPEGWKVAQSLAEIVRGEDRTRPVTCGCHVIAAGYNGFQTVVDVFGYNYKPAEYPKLHASQPQLPVFGSETASTVSTRGDYFFPTTGDKFEGRADFQVSSDDLHVAGSSWTPDEEFRGLDEAPYAAGEFVWTGFDYLGEPSPFGDDVARLLRFTDDAAKARALTELRETGALRVATRRPFLLHFTTAAARAAAEKGIVEQGAIPVRSRSSYFGIVDLAGFKKDRFYLYQARWRPDFPMAHLLPHWTWPERVGAVTPVFVYTSGDEAELFLNGRSLGRRKRGRLEYRLRWDDVRYEPGELHVVAYRNGAKWAEDTVRTAGPAAKLAASVDRATVRADGSDLAFVTVSVTDERGTLVPRTHPRVKFEVSGPADVIATDNGDPTSFEPFQAREHSAFNGVVLAIVRTRAGQPGAITVKATADALQPAELTIESR